MVGAHQSAPLCCVPPWLKAGAETAPEMQHDCMLAAQMSAAKDIDHGALKLHALLLSPAFEASCSSIPRSKGPFKCLHYEVQERLRLVS